jgi:hypothetical protein
MAAMIVGHQLSPVVGILSLACLAWFGHARTWRLAVASGAMFVAWLSYGAADFWRGHLGEITGGVGKIGNTASANVGGRVRGAPSHIVVVDARMLFVAALAATAVVAFFRGCLGRRSGRLLALLATTPFAILLVQSYGGEGLLRSYFFALPFASLLGASLIPRAARRSTLTTTIAVGVAAALAPILILTRYGNDSFDVASAGEIRAAEFALKSAPPGVPILSLNEHWPTMFTAIERHTWINFEQVLTLPPTQVVSDAARYRGAWMVITRSQDQYGVVAEGRAPGWTERVIGQLQAEGHFRVVYRSADATILVNTHPVLLPQGATHAKEA